MPKTWRQLRWQLAGWAMNTALIATSSTAISATASAQNCDAPGASVPCDCEGCRQFLGTSALGVDCDNPMLPGQSLPGYAPLHDATPSDVQPESMQPSPPGEGMPPSDLTPVPESGDAASIPSMNDLTATPDSAFAAANDAPAVPPVGGLASSLGATSGFGGVPDMIGDFFGSGFKYGFVGTAPDGVSVGTAGGDRRVKFAENNSPFPRNRVFFNYNNFGNALVDPNGNDIDVNRYTFGLERAFYDNMLSAEIRVPFAGTLSSSPTLGQSADGTELGNVTLAFKGLLFQDECSALSAGLAVVLPTGADYTIQGDIVDNVFRNESVHLQPFLGLYYAPQPRVFTQFFTQLDFDTEGNGVSIAGINDKLRDQTLLFLDLSIGYWLQKNPHARYFRSIAPMLELHYSTSLESQGYGAFEDVVLSGNSIGNNTVFIQDYNRDVLNLTGGLFFELTQLTTVKLGAVAPLRTGSDRQFDSEFGVQVTRRY